MGEIHDEIQESIDPVRSVYETLLRNSVLRNRLNNAGISDSQQREVARLMRLGDVASDDAYDPYDLYTCIEAMLSLARALTTDVGPSIRRELCRPYSQMSRENRIALQMTLSNLDSNVRALIDRISDLYIATTHFDEHRNGAARSVLRRHFRELTDWRTWDVWST